jgi:thiamine biosynthesis lipoprotein
LPPASDSVRRARPLLGTFVDIMVAHAAAAQMHAAVEAAFAGVATVHRLMSFHEVTSDVARLNREASARPIEVHSWTYQVLATALELHERSAGVFDIAVAPALQHLGLLPRADGERKSVSPRVTARAIALLPGRRVRFEHPATRIDLGGIAKGFAVDRAIEILKSSGIPSALVNAGGDLAAFGPQGETINIRDPRNPHRLMLRVKLANAALACSGQSFDPFRSAQAREPAVVDPSTGQPARTAQGAVVRAPTCTIADALTKVVMLAGTAAGDLLDHYRASALIVPAAGDIRITQGLQGDLYLAA